MSETYDVFLSHKSDDKPWVETLGRNLLKHGKTVFLDLWKLAPGHSWVQGLQDGLKKSKAGVLVCTPAAMESNWVRHEMDWMVKEHVSGDFPLIPVLLDPEIPDIPFLDTVQAIDLSRRELYQNGFGRLLKALDGEPAGPDFQFDGELEIPDYSQYEAISAATYQPSGDWIDEVFEAFHSQQAVAVFAQEYRIDAYERKRLLDRADREFEDGRVIRLVPPIHPGRGEDEQLVSQYFRVLGRRIDRDAVVSDAASFQELVQYQLDDDRCLLLVFTGFENGFAGAREQLAKTLRALNEGYPDLCVLLNGGKKLHDLFYGGELSFLNHACPIYVPDLCLAEATAILERRYPGRTLDAETVNQMLAWTGHHPQLLERLAKGLNDDPPTEALAREVICRAAELHQAFGALLKDADFAQQLPGLLRKADVGPYRPHETDRLIRSLYWRNLIFKHPTRNRLVWRSDLLREAGQKIVEAGA